MQHEGHLVDGVRHIARLDDRVQADVAEHGEFLPNVGIERPFRAANQDLRLQTDLAQLRDALLRRFGLQLARRPDVGHERDVHVDDVLRADLENELPDRFEERQPFDVARRPADLGDDHVDFFRIGHLPDARLDLVGDVRDHLHGFAEIIAAALFQDDALVDLAAREVVVPREDAIGEALVVAEVEIGLGAVVQDVDFAVLKRVHRSRDRRSDRGRTFAAGRAGRAVRARCRGKPRRGLCLTNSPHRRLQKYISSRTSLARSPRRCEQLALDRSGVVRRVHPGRAAFGHDHVNVYAILQRAQLLERFRLSRAATVSTRRSAEEDRAGNRRCPGGENIARAAAHCRRTGSRCAKNKARVLAIEHRFDLMRRLRRRRDFRTDAPR